MYRTRGDGQSDCRRPLAPRCYAYGLGLESVQCVVLVHAIRVEQVKEILGHLIRGGRKISALFAVSTEGTADLVQDALPVLLGTLPVDDNVNIPYRPGFASRYAFRLDMLSERSSFLSGQIRNEKPTAGHALNARTCTVREAMAKAIAAAR